VDMLLKLNDLTQIVRLQTRLVQLNSKIETCTGKINDAVYQLYRLTKEEIGLVVSK
jgi:hypothetical protein